LRVGLSPGCHANEPTVQSTVQSTRTGARQLLLVGRLPHLSCRMLHLGSDPRAGYTRKAHAACASGLSPGCHANAPRCNRPSNPQGRAAAGHPGGSAPTVIYVQCCTMGLTRERAPRARLMRLARRFEPRVPCEYAEVQSTVPSTRTGAGSSSLVGRLPHACHVGCSPWVDPRAGSTRKAHAACASV
jgi:hypothetical protein